MAEKKSWRDYLDSVQAGESSENQKTSTWRDYVSEKTGTVDTSTSGWRGQLDHAITNVAGNQITTQVNNWLTNHNNYIKGYQDRYSGRKYSYEDAYVSDSAAWLDTITKQKSEYDTEADNILSYLDQYADYLDSKWVDDVKKTITEARNTQNLIIENATKDNEYWAKFTPNDQQLAAGYTADKVYQEWQAGQKQYADDMVYDVNAGMLELEALKKEKEAYLADQEEKRKQAESNKSFWDQLGEWLGTTPDTTLPLGGVSAVDGVNRTTKYDKQIAELEDRIERAKYVQGYEGYMANASASDYAPNSQYVSTRTDVAMEDALWGFGTSTQYDKSKLFGDYLYDYINRNQDALDVATVNDTASDATFLGLDKSFLQTMSDKEIGVYNYLYNTQGKDAANEYLSYIGGDLKARKAAQEQEYWAKYAKENPVASSVFSTLISPLKGFSYLGQAADMLDDGKMEENAGYNRFSNIPSTIRSTVTTTIENSGKWGKVGSFAYNTGMSMADFLFSTAVSGGNQGLSLAIMGTGAAADATIAAKQRGLDDAEAFTLGTIAGVAEVAMEKISLGAWLEGDMTEGALRYVLKNALSEGAEEAGTSIVNLLADVIIAGDKSEWNMAMQAYIDEGKSPQEAFGLVAAEQAAQIGLDALGGALSGAAIGGGTYASTSAVAGVQYKDFKNNAESVKGVVTESLELNPTNQYAQKMQGKLDNGKSLTGMQIRNLLAANQEQITSNDMKKIQKTAETILTKYGETGDVSKIAELATKWATGQDLTLAEKRTLTKSDYGSRVANEMLPENIKSGGFNSGWAEGIGTQIVNAKAYNKKTIEAVRSVLDAMAKAENPSTYKSLEERVGTESSYSVSESGKATISGEAVSLDNVEVKSINAKDMTVTVDGKEVKASEIDFADESQSYLFDAVSKIENITPAAATAIIRDYNPNSGLTVGEYLNGIDEGYTYGYYGYSEADLNAGNFAQKLSKEQMMSAYKLGQSAKKISGASKTDTIKRMRTAVEAEAQKAVAEGKEAPKAKKMTITYNDKGKIVDFDKAGLKKLSTHQKAAPAFAQVMHEMGLGTNFELYSSYVNADGKRVILNENGVEVAAPAGIYRKSDGTVCIDLNAYNGKELTLDSMSHELTHFIQQWSDTKYQVLADFLIKTYEKTDLSMHERVVREQNRLEKLRNKEVSYDEAFDEVVANAMSKMLADGKVMERLAELKAKDASLAEKLWAGIKKLLNKFFRVYENSPALFNDAADLMELKAEFEQMQKMWAEAFVEASENFQAYRIAVETEAVNSLGENAKVETNESGELLLASNESGNVQMYSEQTYLNGGREKLEMALRQNGHTAEEIKETLSYVDDALDYIKILAAGYAKEMGYTNLSNHLLAEIVTNVKTGKQVMSAIVNNGDYPVNIDLSLICKKRVAYMNLMSRLIRDGVFDKVNYDGAAIAEVNEILRENGFETACLGCFVESRRLQFQTWAETIVSEWNAEVEKRNPNAKDFGFAKGKMEELTDADIDALTRELESVKKNDQGNVNLGQGNSVTRMGRLLDALPSLQKKLTVEDLLTPEGLTALRKHDGSLFSIVKSRYGAASPKIVQDFNPYASEIAMLTFAQVKGITNNAVKGAQAYVTEVKNEYGKLTKTKGESKENFKKRKDAHEQRIQDEAMRRYLYDIGGARIQSFSDFMIENIFDYIQIFADLAAKRLPLHGYSKEIVCLRLFGMTGAKWNGSLIAHVERSMDKEFAGLLPAGTKDGIPVTVDGKDYVIGFDDYARNAATGGKSFIQSIGMKDIIALQLDPRYSPYVGNITIGVSDAQILAMLDSPLFRMVIPYHASGMLPMFAKLVGVDMYNDYTDYQNTSVRQYYDLNGKTVSELKNSKGETVKADTSYAFNAEIQKTKDAKAAANNYLKWCAQRHPVYDGSTLVGYATFNPKFSSSPFGTDFTRHENYYKLLEDFNTYDCITENSAVQGSVTMNFPSEANRLTERQMAEYQNALRETGIFTERDIEKYAKKANMTFKEIIAAEVGNRANYAATQAPKWESTVKAVEEKLQRDYARDQYSSQETDLDTDAEADYDGVNNQYANVTKGTEQEDQSNDTREESREDFDRRTSEEVLRKGQKGRLAYAYRPYLGTPSQNAQAAREGLKKIGIPVFIYEKLETNKRGITTDHKASGAAAIPGVGVFIPFDTTVDSMEIVGHEGFHFLGASKTRTSYLLKLVDNIDFASAEFIAYQTKYVQEKYFEEEVGTEDEGFDLLAEEIFAYITGDIHNGDPDGEVHKFIRDYDAVKSAWDDLIKKQAASGAGQALYSTHETDLDSHRAMLANAFEGITQNSNEYKLIQEYKGRIKLLNEYEAKLSDLNAEIRKILFESTGARDTARLAQLQAEAKQVAENINRNDKKLLSLEASEPLRKVIERERKKESQKTKAHVKEIIQNKKVRAEQTEMRHKIRKAIRDLDKLLNRGNKKLNVKEDMQEVVSTALKAADILFTDNYGTYDMLRNGIGTNLSDAEEALVDACTKMLKDLDNMTVDGYDSFQARQEAEDKLRTKMSKLNDVFARERKRLNTTTVSSILGELSNAYAKLKDSDQSYVQGAYSEPVHNFLKHLQEEVGGTIVQDMTMNQLESVYAAYKMVLSAVRNANKLFVKGKSESIEQIATQIVMDFGSRKIPEKELAIAVQKITNKIGWDYEKLYYALDRIGSEAFTELIMNIANSENIVMQDVIEAAEFRDRIVEKYGFNNWDVNKKIDREFLDHTGKKFTMTLGEMMSLYAYSRREGAWDHIEYGGFVFGEKALTDPKPADSYKLSKEQCEAITNLLTKEQKGYVEEMQKFLSETMGNKGNEVSLQLYGIKMFKEKNYFPIHVAGEYHAIANESQAQAAEGFSAMSNAGFTHAQNPNAKAPFVLESFNEIWSDHVNEMSRYHGTVPALEDLRRVMNRSFYSESTAESTSVKVVMENHFGEEAVKYFDNLYKEANSGAITDKLENKHKKFLSLFRKNSVAYSLSVLIQQPASLVRAYALIDKKYFGFKGFGTITSGVAKAAFNKWTKAHTNAYNEMLQYAPGVTMAKEIGGFDTATGGSIRSYLLDTNKKFSQQWKTGTVAEKGKAVLDKVDNNAIANLPNVADKIAWIEIWNACKRETVAKYKDLAPTSAEFLQIVGERFTEVIRATQVYDSIFAKSPMMKSKRLYVQMLVSFMNEPNTIANMAESAVRNATRGNWKQGARTGVVVLYSIIFTNVLKSIIYAMRDDDEDETYAEKYIEALVGGIMNDIDAPNYIPLLRDVASVAKGYDVERSDMAIFADLIDAIEKVDKYSKTDTEDMTEEQLIELDKKQTEANWKLVESLASFLGIPVKNIRREINAVIDHARIASENVGSTTVHSALDKVIDSLPDFLAPKVSKTDKLYEAIVSGDKAYEGRIKATYKDDAAYNSAVRKALRENDSRIHDAAQAKVDGNTEEYKRIFREIKDEGKFSFDDIMSAINSEESAIRNKIEPEKVTSSYTASDFIEAIVLGDPSNAQTVRNDIIATHMANGKSEAEAEMAFASSVSSGIRDAYSSGLLDKAGAERMLVEYAGKDEDEAASKVNQWAFIEAHPEYDYFTESNVAKYHEFAEPENISLEVYAQFINGTKGLTDKLDKWGEVEETKRDQVLAVIDSLPLTWQQKDALYLAAGYSESKIWDVPW